MAEQYANNYAKINLATGQCIAVITTSEDRSNDPTMVEIPVYDEEYTFKYYINGAWYEDAAGTIPWTSAL